VLLPRLPPISRQFQLKKLIAPLAPLRLAPEPDVDVVVDGGEEHCKEMASWY
jgi:hypothetical protein